MTEFRPLLESSPNPKTRSILRAGLADAPSPRAAERAAAALGVTLGLSANAAGATMTGGGAALAGAGAGSISGSAQLGALVIVKWLAVGAVSGTLVAGGSTLVRHGVETSPGTTTRADAARGVAVETDVSTSTPGDARAEREPNAKPSREASAARTETSGTVRPGAEHEVARLSPTQNQPPTNDPSPATATFEREGPLTLELERIDRARAALASGAADRALYELSQYERVRTTGTLDREAWILRIDALLARGQRGEAKDLARRYLARFPRDAHATRLRELAEAADATNEF